MLCCIMAMPIYCETCAFTYLIVIRKQDSTPVKCIGTMPRVTCTHEGGKLQEATHRWDRPQCNQTKHYKITYTGKVGGSTIIASYKTPVDTRSEHVEKAVNPTLHCEDGRLP